MQSKIIIRQKYSNNAQLKNFVDNISDIFPTNGNTLYNKRNVIKSFVLDESDSILNDVIVKRYKRPNFFQCIAYSFFRPGKAKRAFYNSITLRERGIDTPEGLCYIEQKNFIFLKDSYFISSSDYGSPIQERLNDVEDFDKNLAKQFAEFAVLLHEKGILHHDLNQTNVLYHLSDNGHFYFSVIDTNRMTTYNEKEIIPQKECFDNLTRFTRRMDLFEFVVKNYIAKRGWDESLLSEAIDAKVKFDTNRRKKKAFLAKFKRKK